MLSRFHLIPERNGQTDVRTDRQICYINISDKNEQKINPKHDKSGQVPSRVEEV